MRTANLHDVRDAYVDKVEPYFKKKSARSTYHNVLRKIMRNEGNDVHWLIPLLFLQATFSIIFNLWHL